MGVILDHRRPWLFQPSVADDYCRLFNKDSGAQGGCGYVSLWGKGLVLKNPCSPVDPVALAWWVRDHS